MMKTIDDIMSDINIAMKEANPTRVAALRSLSNTVKMIAKNDKNREPVPDDVITAANRMIKQARETLSFLESGDDRQPPLEYEISVATEYLPKQLDETELKELISAFLDEAPDGKAARGFVMKNLNEGYRGQFDSKSANEILSSLV
jgi:uncharacterized protein YqeY